MKKILSIVIPTYNRVNFLKTNVELLINQIKTAKLENIVEVIISNDASKDETADFINHINKSYDFLRGFNHIKNKGFSKNVEFLISKSVGEYVLICGDDDLIIDKAITRILDKIKKKKPNFILINTSNIISIDDANKNIRTVSENRLNIDKDIFVEDFKKDSKILDSARNWLYLTNFITANVFKKDIFISKEIDARKFVRKENAYAFQAPIIIGIATLGRFLIISDCLVLHRKTEPNWTADYQGIFVIDILDSTEISKLIKNYIPNEYKKYKKLYAAFILDDFILEIKRRKDKLSIRKFASIAFYKNIDCFPENIKFLLVAIAPKISAYIATKIRANRIKSSGKTF